MRGNEIIVTANPRGVFREGYLKSGQSAKPGMILMLDASVALQGGVHTYKLYDRAADGDRPAGALWILLQDWLQGMAANGGSYSAGDRIFLYSPVAGEEFNLLLGDVSGTGDDHALGELLMVDDGTGKLIAYTGTPQSAPFQLKEAITDPTTDTLAWVDYGAF